MLSHPLSIVTHSLTSCDPCLILTFALNPSPCLLQINTSIEVLNLEGNWIGSEGAHHLCHVLKENVYITYLVSTMLNEMCIYIYEMFWRNMFMEHIWILTYLVRVMFWRRMFIYLVKAFALFLSSPPSSVIKITTAEHVPVNTELWLIMTNQVRVWCTVRIFNTNV